MKNSVPVQGGFRGWMASKFAGKFGLRSLADYGIIFAFVALFVIPAISSPAFLSPQNLHNIVDQAAHIGIVAIAMTIVIIGGSFDLSVGAIFATAGSLSAIMARMGYPGWGLVLGLVAGVVLGLANGLIITTLRVHSFIATLASSLIIRGIALLVTGGLLILVKNTVFTRLGQGVFLDIKYPVFIFAAFALATGFLLSRTSFGRYVYAIGGNAEAARLSGIRVDLVRTITFAISGFGAALAGLITVSRISQGQADIGNGLELDAIAATVIGGTSILGGEGAVWRTVLGVLLLRLIANSFNLMNVEPFYQRVFTGAVIIFAVALDTLSKRRT